MKSVQIIIKIKFIKTQSKNAKIWFFVILDAKKLTANIEKISKILQKIWLIIIHHGKFHKNESEKYKIKVDKIKIQK